MKELDKTYDFKVLEEKNRQFWQSEKIYKWNPEELRENNFVIDTPPPTVSGFLHMGHVFSYTQADFIARFQRMLGKNVFYPMGFDDNGLPTERLVEKQRNVRGADMPRADFIKICQEVVVEAENQFRSLFKGLALSVDWSQEYQTISARSRAISQMSFIDLYKKGQIYRSEQPVLWDPIDRTALSQADIEDKEKQSSMNEIKFTTEEEQEVVIATTRPELLAACVAVFFNPEDDRYKNLEGKFAITPLFKARVPFLADDAVDIEKGTGLVMCCTFGDTTDLMWWKKHKLPLRIIITKDGRIQKNDLSDVTIDLNLANKNLDLLSGLKIKEAREKIIYMLTEEEVLLGQKPLTQIVKCAERSGAPLEILTAPQWFIRSLDHKEALLERSKELDWYPKSMKIRLDSWIENLSWDWCISRQRYFGVPFPAWYSKRPGEVGKLILAEIDQLPVDPIQDLPKGYSRDEVIPDIDVMDTWATSSVTPQLSSHGIWNEFILDEDRHSKLYPADLRPQAHEIIRTWAFTTILKSHLHSDCLPWKNIMISGWCLAEDKTKMSKSKGNVVTPEKLLNDYGSDIVRYWASTSKLGADTAYSEEVMKNGKRLVNKLWNAAKLVSINLKNLAWQQEVPLQDLLNNKDIHCQTDLWLLTRLKTVIEKAKSEFLEFEYCNARSAIEEFFWRDFCDNYLEISKARAYNQEGLDRKGQLSALYTMYYTLKNLLKLLAPFIPHICEEIFQAIYANEGSVNKRGAWPDAAELPSEPKAFEETTYLIQILDLVRKAKAEKNLSIKAPIQLIEIKSQKRLESIASLNDLKNVISADKISFVENFVDGQHIVEDEEVSINVIYKTMLNE
ncbi:MAG: valS [Rickettsiaceae bacterium]|jgi:valyl-tRNA synthetase|nr:valS [Rickettsiaceae bacterium]